VGQAGLTDAAKLATGIALILKATLAGLLIAIPSLIAWSYYSKRSRCSPWRWRRCATSFSGGNTQNELQSESFKLQVVRPSHRHVQL